MTHVALYGAGGYIQSFSMRLSELDTGEIERVQLTICTPFTGKIVSG